jgi:hypothetical protein
MLYMSKTDNEEYENPYRAGYDLGYEQGLREAKNIDVRALAEAAGLKSYDTALPLSWYVDVHKKTGYWPQNYGVVWCYDTPSVWGVPYPLTEMARVIVEFYNAVVKLEAA